MDDSGMRRVRKRIIELASMNDGWFDGVGSRPVFNALVRAHSMLSTLSTLSDVERFIDDVRLYPTFDGGVSIEWTMNRAAVDVFIDPGGAVEITTTAIFDDSVRNTERSFEPSAVNKDVIQELVFTLKSVEQLT